MGAVVQWTMPLCKGGSGREAAYFDNDFKLSDSRLRAIVQEKAGTYARETLARISVARCETTLEFLAGLELVKQSQKKSSGRLLIVIDSLGAFFWREEKLATEHLAPPSFTAASCRLLGKLLNDDKALIIAAKPVLFLSQKKKKKVPVEQEPPWNNNNNNNNNRDDDHLDDNDEDEDFHVDHPPPETNYTNPPLTKKKTRPSSFHAEYMPRDWTKLVRRRMEVEALSPLFSFRLFDATTDRSPSLRAHHTFAVSKKGVHDWRLSELLG